RPPPRQQRPPRPPRAIEPRRPERLHGFLRPGRGALRPETSRPRDDATSAPVPTSFSSDCNGPGGHTISAAQRKQATKLAPPLTGGSIAADHAARCHHVVDPGPARVRPGHEREPQHGL